MALTIGELVAIVKLKDNDFKRGVAEVRSGISSMNASLARIGGMSIFSAAMAGAAVKAMQLGAAMAPAAGAVLLLPAAALAAATVLGVLKIAFAGVSDALKSGLAGDTEAFNKALDGMAGSTAKSLRAIVAFRPEIENLKKSVSGAVFDNMADRITSLGEQYLPLLTKRLAAVGSAWNSAFRQTADLATSAQSVADVDSMLQNTAVSSQYLSTVMAPVAQILRDIGVTGSGFLPQLAANFGNAAQRAAEFIAQARETGKLHDWISGALDVLQQLGDVATNVGGIFKGIFTAAQEGGGGALNTLVAITGALSGFLNSAEGQAALTAFFQNAGIILSGLLPIVLQLAGAAGTVLAPALGQVAIALMPAVDVLAGALIEAVTALAPHLPVLAEGFAAMVIAAAPILPVLGQIAGVIATVVGAVAQWASDTGLVMPIIIGWFTAVGVRAAVSAGQQVAAWATASAGAVKTGITYAATFVRMVAGWVATGAKAMVGAGIQVAAWLLSQGPAAAAAATAVVAFLAMAGGWIASAATATISALAMAAAWLIAMGPIPLIIAAIVGLVALIILNWDTVKSWTIAVWDAIVGAVKAAADWVVGILSAAWDLIVTGATMYWELVKGIFVAVWDFLVNLVTGYINMVVTILTAGWDFVVQGVTLYWNLVKTIFTTVWNFLVGAVTGYINTVLGIIGWFGQLPGRVSGWFNSVKQAAVDKLVALVSYVTEIPGKVISALGQVGTMLYNSGAKIVQGLIDGIKSKVGDMTRAVKDMVGKAKDMLPFSPAKTGPFSGKGNPFYSGRSIARLLAQGLSEQEGLVASASERLMSNIAAPVNGATTPVSARRDAPAEDAAILASIERAFANAQFSLTDGSGRQLATLVREGERDLRRR